MTSELHLLADNQARIDLSTLEVARSLYCTGDYKGLLAHQGTLTASLRAEQSPDDDAELRAMLAWCHLVFLNNEAASLVLSPFITKLADGIRVDAPAVDMLRQNCRSRRSVGLILLQVGRLQYRSGALSQSQQTTSDAHRELMESDPADAFAVLAREEANILEARIAYRRGQRSDAEERLRLTIGNLNKRLLDRKYNGGVATLIAHAYGLQASFAWTEGRFQDARNSVYHTSFFLRDAESRAGGFDELGLAYALYLAGRIEAGHADASLELSLHLLGQSEKIFRPRNHPFLRRVLVQIAQAYVKANELGPARMILKELEDIADQAGDEMSRIEGDIRLTQIWMLAASKAAPAQVLTACQSFFDMRALLPGRLAIEAELHLGIALIRAGSSEAGRRYVERALGMAGAEGRTTIATRAHLALAESYIGQDRPKAVEHFRAGQALLATHPSSFLLKLRDRLAPQLESGFQFHLDGLIPFYDAVREFKRRYIEFHLSTGLSKEELAERMKVSRANFFAILKKLGLTSRSKGEE